MSYEEIGARSGRSARYVRDEVKRMREADAEAVREARQLARDARRLIPLFPVGLFAPQSPCPHLGPVPAGRVCMVCHGRPAPVVHA